ncbi:MAG: ATP-binding protein [Pseudomonadota bacterium]|nr:ATP-binding protein [Pseudomonadota bacterium]
MAVTRSTNWFIRLIWISRLGAMALVLAAAIALDTSSSSIHRSDTRQQWQVTADEISLRLQSAILQNIQTVWGLAANVSIEPDIDGRKFQELASVIFSLAPDLRNIGLAPDLVIRHIFPLQGNEAAIGLDLTAQSLSESDRQMLLDSRRVVFSGPINLVQGGQGLAGRLPIFEQASGEFWGVVSVILDLQKLFASVGLNTLPDEFNLALSVSDDIRDTDAIFLSSGSDAWDDPVTSTIRMSGATWVVFAQPAGGWPNHPRQPWLFRGSLLAMLILVAGGVFWLTSLMTREREMQRRFWGLFELAPMGIGLFSAHSGRLLSANPTFQNQFGNAAQSLDFFDRPCNDQGLPANHLAPVRKTLANRQEFSGLEAYYTTPGQSLAPFRLHGLQLEKYSSEPVIWLITEDISEQRKADLLKNEFVSTVSHELRTPLTSISGSLGLLASNAAGALPEKASKLAQIAYRNSQQLTFLINDLLDIEKLAAGKMPFRCENHDLKEIVRESVENISALAQKRRVSLEWSELATAKVYVDRRRLNQAITNLLSNAIKFSPAGASVEVFTELPGDDAVRLCIRDHGEGIPAHFRDQIFQKFSQATSSAQGTQAGTGLGLAITKELMTRMNGTVGYDSSPGKGATFWLDMPIVMG